MKLLITTQLDMTTQKLLDEKNTYYHPEIAKTPGLLQNYILRYKPDCLVVGANAVFAEDLKVWRNTCSKQKLFIIRRGTGLSSIDLPAAATYKIVVHNTPDVNSPYVAQYILDNLLMQPLKRNVKIAIVGAGSINSRVAKKLLLQGFPVTIFSPSLCVNEKRREIWMKEWNTIEYKDMIAFATSLEESLESADYISIAIPLIESEINKTKHILTNASVRNLAKNATVISICEPDIFTTDALIELYRRQDITVLLDNAKPLLEEAWRRMTKQLDLSLDSSLRENFILQSQAMQMPGCARDMDEAILLKIATIELEQLSLKKNVLKQARDLDKKIVIVGAGISGMMQALVLCEQGCRDITIIEANNYTMENIPEEAGITFSGGNCRHISLTETTPHADKTREKILTFPPSQGGWQLRSTEMLTAPELYWITAFEQFTQKSGLHNIAKEFIVTLNKKGWALWELLLERNPELLSCLQKEYPVLRIFLSEESLQNGWITQKEINKNPRFVDQETLQQTQKYLQSAIKANYVTGGVTVNGFGLHVHDFMKQLVQLLQNKGVKFLWNTKIVTIEEREDKIKSIGAQTGERISSDFFIFSTGSNSYGLFQGTNIDEKINGVIGCWLTIPNPGLTGPLKIHAEEPAGVINCIVASNPRDIHISGGFGYIGKGKVSLTDRQVVDLFDRVEQVIKRLFPKEYLKAKEDDSFCRKICARPMTPDGIPIVEFINAKQNAVFIGGTNAGGTVEAPILCLFVAAEGEISCNYTKTILKTSRYSL